MHSTRPRFIAIPLLLLIAGCMTWGRAEPPATALSRVDKKPIQVARTDHSTIILRNASVVGDSLVGTADDSSKARVSIPISEIVGVSTREVDPGRTLALTGGIVLGTLGALFIALIIAISNSNWID